MTGPKPITVETVLERLPASWQRVFAGLPDLFDPALLDSNARIIAGRMSGWEKAWALCFGTHATAIWGIKSGTSKRYRRSQ